MAPLLIMAPPSFSGCEMFDFTEVRIDQLFSSFTTLLYYLLWANKILNVDKHERNYIFINIYATFSCKLNWQWT